MSSPSHRATLLLRGVTVFVWIVTFVLTHLPPSEVPKTRFGDKYAHFIAYLVLASLLYLCVWASKRPPAAAIVLAAGCIYGAFDELTQPLVGRTCSMADWIADVAGTLAAVGLLTLIRLIKPAPHN